MVCSLFRKKDGTYRGTKICMCFEVTGEAPFCALAFSYVVRTKKGSLLYHTCTWFVTRKAPCYLAVTWERCRTKILKGLCGVIGWFQVAADIELPLK